MHAHCLPLALVVVDLLYYPVLLDIYETSLVAADGIVLTGPPLPAPPRARS